MKLATTTPMTPQAFKSTSSPARVTRFLVRPLKPMKMTFVVGSGESILFLIFSFDETCVMFVLDFGGSEEILITPKKKAGWMA
jgi:hypothetical protein